MNDVLPGQIGAWQQLERVTRELFAAYGYEEMRVPVVEHTGLFKRAIGEFTDIVEKEMYTFTDSGGDSLTLRPEATAGVVRAAITNGLLRGARLKLWTSGPMFRHERPQKGRYRQFHQIDVEALGFAGPDIDAEMIAMTARLWKRLGISRVRLKLNSLGTTRFAQGLSREAGGLFHSSTPRRSMPTASDAWAAIRCASSTARTRPCRPWSAARRCSPNISTPSRANTSMACAPRWRPWASTTSSIRAWCAASTTTRAPCSSGSPTRWARRTPCAPAAATTA